MATATSERQYVLGHTDSEMDRLQKQSDFYSGITKQALALAGIQPGMRVLDAGCGAGDVSLQLARHVGPTGEVIAIDRAPEAVALTIERASRTGFENLHGIQGDITDLQLDAPVDAVFGRLILMHVPEPVAAIRNLAGQVATGGIIAFQEMDIAVAGTDPDVPLASQMLHYLKQAFERAGVDVRPGLRLPRHFADAGSSDMSLVSLGRVEPAPAPASSALLTAILRTMLPVIEATGVATPADIDLDTLDARLQTEVTRAGAVVITPPLITAWATVS